MSSRIPYLATLALFSSVALAPAAAAAQEPPANHAAAPPPAAAAPARTADAAPPPPQPSKPIRFPAFEQRTLANGLRVVVIEQHEQPAVSLRLLARAGQLYAPAGKAGLAQATAALLTEGTATRSAQQVAEAIDGVGGSLGAGADTDAVYASAQVTSDQLALGLDLLSDIVLHPSFPAEEVERWRRQGLAGLKVQQESPAYLADAAFARLLYGDHPYGEPLLGTPESVQALTRDDLVAFHRSRYVPNEAILAVVGDVKPADAFARVERAFGGWKRGEAAKAPAFSPAARPANAGRRIVVVDKPDAVQTEIRIGQPVIAYGDPDFFAAAVYNSVLGASPASRLFDEVRRKKGLSYGAYSSLSAELEPGPLKAATSTKNESTVEALGLMLDVLAGLEKTPVPADELTARKTYISGAFPLEIETPDGIATKVLEAMFYGLGKDFLESYNSKVEAVGAKEVEDFAGRRIHPEQAAIVLVGDAKSFAAELEKKGLGKVEVIPYRELDLLQADLRRPKPAAAAPASAAETRQGAELLAKVRQALGGEKFAKQRTQVASGSGTMSPPGMPQPLPISSIKTYQVLPAKNRSELASPMGTMVQVYNGEAGWVAMGDRMQDQTAAMKEQSFHGYEMLRRFDEPGMTVKSLPEGELDGRKLARVEVADAEGHATQFWIDPATALPAALEYSVQGQTNRELFSDFREVDGVQVPFQTDIVQNGQKVFQIKYAEVEVNAPVDEKLFAKPEGGANPAGQQ